jgi:hypothetical protein
MQILNLLTHKKEKNVYFSNMKKIIKHYPMTDRLIVRRGYIKKIKKNPNSKCLQPIF